ncbi:MAG: hypothetical protein GC206_06385 [Alphaproteobacteria bacterium]|nr:hypothetical protein [Alphaproteobacteria bacterium]
MTSPALQRRASKWRDVVLICRKCSRRAGGGFGPNGKRPLAKALRKALDLPKGRRAKLGIAEIGCLGVCPKDAVTLVRGTSPDEILVAPVDAPLDDIIAALKLKP